MDRTVQAFIDHACPYSFMAFAALCEVTRLDGLTIRWRMLPIAGPGGLDPAEAGMHALYQVSAWPRIQALAEISFGLRLHPPLSGVDGRPSAALSRWADRHDAAAGLRLHRRVFEACFRDGQDIGDPTVLGTLAAEAGLGEIDPPRILSAAGAADDRRADIAAAARHGVTAVPAIVVGDHLLLGAQPVAVLRQGLGLATLAGAGEGAGPR